jgi:N6-adenosine-specific RNA methylase IME4
MRYKTIYADPPWPEYGGGKIKRGADKHYPLMKIANIIALGIELQRYIDQEGCHLYLWTTNNYLREGLQVMEAWGFDYKTTITWVKDRIGIGQYFRGLSEHCLFGVHGRLPYRLKSNGKRGQGQTAFFAPRSIHSRKPEEMREMIETVSYAPRLELFARTRHQGWDAWGNEVQPDIMFTGIPRPTVQCKMTHSPSVAPIEPTVESIALDGSVTS